MKPAPIVSLHEAAGRCRGWVMTSGGYDPIHPGHMSLMADAADLGPLVVVVNGDAFLTVKKGRPFQDLATRCQIVSYVRGVAAVVPYEIADDMTVNGALSTLLPTCFVKGGDRDSAATIPEYETCRRLGIRVITGLGLPKRWSSSEMVAAR